MSRRAVFLDRDGVINAAVVRDGKPYAPADVSAVRILPGVRTALEQLGEAGFVRVVVTNQPDVARGAVSLGTVEAIHALLRRELPLDAIYVCYHDDADHCACRKPAPGMLLDAARDLDLDLAASFIVGDRWRDVEAGIAAGCRTIWINRHYQERAPTNFDVEVDSLPSAAAWILDQGAQ